jgi:DNA-binding beta-propeller fold protein YncE
MRRGLRCCTRLALLGAVLGARIAAATFTEFESDVVRPLALSADGTRLYAVNTPDARLEVLRVTDAGLALEASVPVGLEPVAVAVRSPNEVWVVNHLSDSVSVVDVAAVPPRVTRTLWVGDEPRDLVFAGSGRSRAFITTAHRGQNSPVDPDLFIGGVGRADVWVFDATALGTSAGGTPLTVLTLFGDTPRALATSPDGNTVYAAVYRSGNLTTTVGRGSPCGGGQDATCEVDGIPMPGGMPDPSTNVFGDIQPRVGLIVQNDPTTGAWHDQIGRDWRDAIRFELPDLDVFAIDAQATPPVAGDAWAHVGTILFDLAVNPVSGRVYVSNTEARNERRFAGQGLFSGSSVRGRLHQARISVLAPGTVTPRHLNKHIDYDVVPSPPGTSERSLAQPMGMAVSGDGTTLYVAAFGSDAVGILDTAALEADTFVPDASARIPVAGGGPTGLALDEPRRRLYVATRFDDGISVLDLSTRTETSHLTLHDPEPAAIVAGRRFFFDARRGSSNGEGSCGTCHVFADTDALAWDLGDPDLPVIANPNPTRIAVDDVVGFRPLKGPMTTQTMRGIATQGPMHWRGDRTGALLAGGDAFDERAALRQFNEAFIGLLGRENGLASDELEQLVDYGLSIVPPPNPLRALDGTRTAIQLEGIEAFYEPDACISCHAIDQANGFFGTDGFSVHTDNIEFFLKVPPLHSVYQKVGMFEQRPPFNNGDTTPVGPQVRGFGFMHDGASGFPPSANRNHLEFVLTFPGPLAPIVGQQVSLTASSDATATARADLLESRAAEGECDLVVRGVHDGAMHGWLRATDGSFTPDRAILPPIDSAALRGAAAAGEDRLYTCMPPGSGARMALDRDEDGFLDGDEGLAGSDPADAGSHPLACAGAGTLGRVRLDVRRVKGDAAREHVVLRAVLPAGDPVDPATSGFALTVQSDAVLALVSLVPGGPAWKNRGRRSTFVAEEDGDGARRITLRRTRAGLAIRIEVDYPAGLVRDGAALSVALGVDETTCAVADLPCCALRARGTRMVCKSSSRHGTCG